MRVAFSAERSGRADGVGDGVGVGDAVGVNTEVGAGVGVGVATWNGVGVGIGVGVGRGVAEPDGLAKVALAIGDGVMEGCDCPEMEPFPPAVPTCSLIPTSVPSFTSGSEVHPAASMDTKRSKSNNVAFKNITSPLNSTNHFVLIGFL